MRVTVIGATGNVGTALLRALVREPEVTAIDAVARRRPSIDPPDKTAWHAADIVRDDLAPLLRGTDAVVHLAWVIQPSRDERTMYAVNVEGSRRVFEAAARAGARTVVHASSVGAYGPGTKVRVSESHPVSGIPTSTYSRHKSAVERLVDEMERRHGDVRWVRLRPGLVFQREAASEIRRLFAGPFLPGSLLRRGLVPIVPLPRRLAVQAVHADDVADAYRRAVVDDRALGAYNVAAEPVLNARRLAAALGARAVPVPERVLRAAASATWHGRLQPTEPGWLDLALQTPLVNTTRIREELGWEPQISATDALAELLHGLRHGAGAPTPPLDPHTYGPARSREILAGVGDTSRAGVTPG